MDSIFKPGDIVKSVSGHDKNKIFLVVSIDKNGYLAIIDGKVRKKEKPKLKNPKHVTKLGEDLNLIKKYKSNLTTNAEMHKLINKFKE